MTERPRLTRRTLLERAVPAALLLAPCAAAPGMTREKERRMEQQWVYVGTSTGKGSKGIYRFRFDPATGRAEPPQLAAEAANPSFLATHPGGRFLYAVNAVGEFRGEKTGAVSAFALDRKSGELRLLNQQPSAGPGPCHVTVDAAGRNVLVANYGGGSVAVLPVDAEGRLAPPSSAIQHRGSSVNPKRQEGPHAHSVNLDRAGLFAFAADLGLDQVLVYRFDPEKGTLAPNDPPYAATAPGAGPRHFAFHPSGRYAYVINELNDTVTAFRYNAERGALAEIQVAKTVPDGFTGENYTAEVQVHPSGKFLYGSNRGHDSIAVFSIDEATGKLTAAGHQPSGGKWPRNFAVDPSGQWMVVGNQNTDNILFFRIDPERGTLTPTGQELQSPAPICFKFVPVAE